MKTPNLPHPLTPVVKQGGQMHDDWYLYFSQLTSELQNNISEEGLGLPQQNTANISVLQASPPKPSIIYNSETDTPLIRVKGVYKAIQTM
jgi:hypothetical protein